MANEDRGLNFRTYQWGIKFIADPTTAPLLMGGITVDVSAFTDATKYGPAGQRFIPAGTVVQIGANKMAVPYAAPITAPSATAFAVSTAYTEGQLVTNNGYTYEVTVAGTSGATAPEWKTRKGSKTTSGDAEFTAVDAAGNNTDTQRPYVLASSVTEAAGSIFLVGSQETSGLYMAPTILIEDNMPEADPKTHELPATIRTALIAEGFKLTKSFYMTEVN